LIFGVNLDQGDALRRISNLVMEPMVFDGIVFGMRCHAMGFQATKGQGTNVVLMHLAVDVGSERVIKTDSRTQFTDERD
jgi:hypothetical protein